MKQLYIVINNFQKVSHNQHLLRLIKYLSLKHTEIILLVLSPKGILKKEFQTVSLLKIVDASRFIRSLKNSQNITILTKELRSEYFIFVCRLILGWKKYRHITIRPSYGFLPESLWKIIKNVLFFFSLELVDLNIAVGDTVYNRIKNTNKICIPNSVDDSFTALRHKSNDQTNKVKCVYTGVLERRKNLSYILSVFELLPKNFDLTILGDGPEKSKLQKEIHDKHMSSRIHVLGQKTDVRQFLERSHVFVFPTKMEGLSLSLLEAMAAGLVCIVSDIPENREVIIDKKNGIVIQLNNPFEAAKKITSTLEDKILTRSLQQQVRETIVKKFYDEITFKAYETTLFPTIK